MKLFAVSCLVLLSSNLFAENKQIEVTCPAGSSMKNYVVYGTNLKGEVVTTDVQSYCAPLEEVQQQQQQIQNICPAGFTPDMYTEVATDVNGNIVFTRNQSYCKKI